MSLQFLPEELISALNNLNINYLTEIRLRSGQPVIIQYRGEYTYINKFSASHNISGAIICQNAEKVLHAAMEKSVYAYSEQLKLGFITVDGGIRIGVAGEYVTQGNNVITVKNVRSLNIRIPHSIEGVADEIYNALFKNGLINVLIFSPPAFGKTTILRALAKNISHNLRLNVLIFDERHEISADSKSGSGYELGETCDVIKGANKLSAIKNAIRVMNPQVIVTDEICGATDLNAVNYVAECGIKLIATTHTVKESELKQMPFDAFVRLTGIGKPAVIYDKNFNFICNCTTVGRVGNGNIG